MEPLEYFLPLMNIHITRGEESSGPFSLEEVQAYLAEGILLPDDLAWHEGLENWIPLSELVGQSALPEPVPPPPSTPDEIDLISADQVPVESVAKPRLQKGLLIGVGAGVAVLVIAAAAWFGFLRPDGSNQKEQQVAQGGEPKDKGTDKDVPAETNSTVVPDDPNENIKPKVNFPSGEPTPRILAAIKAGDEGRYAEAVRLYTAELAAEEAKPTPNWVQLSYLNNGLGLALNDAGQYDKALEYFQKSLAIKLKKLGADHPDVATSYNNIGLVYDNKAEDDQALEYYQKSLAIRLKQLGPDHPRVAQSYWSMAATYWSQKDLPKAEEYYEKAYAIYLKKLGPDHQSTKSTKASLDQLTQEMKATPNTPAPPKK